MKLASLKHAAATASSSSSPNDLAWYADAGHIAPTLQAALDDWDRLLPDLQRPGDRPANTARSRRSASTSTTPPRPCRAPINGPTARPM